LPLPDGQGSDWLLVLDVRHRPAWYDTLTPTERRVLRGLVDRWDNRLLASELRRSVETIKKHVSHILDKAGVDDRNAFANQQYDL
jgi:DNA-binding NarL/FixJ family response regulator